MYHKHMKKLSLSLELEKSIISLIKRITKKEDEYLSKYGLTHFHALYLGHLNLYDELTMVELTNMIGFDKANTTRVVRDLLNKNYVEKTGGERKFKLHLTNLGKNIANDFNKKINIFMSNVMKNFSPLDHENLVNLIDKLKFGIIANT